MTTASFESIGSHRAEQQSPARTLSLWPLLLTVLVLGLTVELIRQKSRNVEARVAIRKTTRAFIRGNPVPGIPVVMADGKAAKLSDACVPGQRLVAVFTQKGCAACERLAPSWTALANESRSTRVLLVNVSGGAGSPAQTPTSPTAEGAPRVAAAGVAYNDFFTAFRLNAVPAVLVTDFSCQVQAGGSGLVVGRTLIDDARPRS